MKVAVQYLLDRLVERNTWLGLIAVVASLGVGVSPDLANVIVQAGVAVAGLVLAITKG